MNRKQLLTLAVVTALSVSLVGTTQAAEVSSYSSSTTTTNSDGNGYTATRESRSESRTTVSTSTTSSTETSSTKSSGSYVKTGGTTSSKSHTSIGIGASSDYVMVPIINSETREAPAAIKTLYSVVQNDGYIKLGQLAMVREGKLWGLVGTDGQVLIAPQYKEMESAIAMDGTYFVRNQKTFEHIKGDGTVITSGKDASNDYIADQAVRKSITGKALDGDAQMDQTKYASDSYTAISEKGKWGFADSEGRTVITPQFKEIYAGFSEDRAFVKDKNGKTVAIDGQGNTVFEAPSKDIDEYRNGLAEYRRHISKFNLGGLLSMAVGIGLSNRGGYGYYGNAWNPVYDGVKRGYIDRNGNIIIDSKNDAVWPMGETGTLVKNGGKLGFMNRQGQYTITPGNYEAGELDNYNALLAMENKDTEKFGVFNLVTGSQVVPFMYDAISFVGLSHMSVVKGESRQIINMATGKVIYTAPKDDAVDVYSGDYTWVHKGKSDYRVVDKDGHVLFTDTAHALSDVTPFSHGYAAVKSNGKWGIINPQGQWIVQPMYNEVTVL